MPIAEKGNYTIVTIDLNKARNKEEITIGGKPLSGNFMAVMYSSSYTVKLWFNKPTGEPFDILDVQSFKGHFEHLYMSNKAYLDDSFKVKLLIADSEIAEVSSVYPYLAENLHKLYLEIKGAGSPVIPHFFELDNSLGSGDVVLGNDNSFNIYAYLDKQYKKGYFDLQLANIISKGAAGGDTIDNFLYVPWQMKTPYLPIDKLTIKTSFDPTTKDDLAFRFWTVDPTNTGIFINPLSVVYKSEFIPYSMLGIGTSPTDIPINAIAVEIKGTIPAGEKISVVSWMS